MTKDHCNKHNQDYTWVFEYSEITVRETGQAVIKSQFTCCKCHTAYLKYQASMNLIDA